jgi:hypothetical protein
VKAEKQFEEVTTSGAFGGWQYFHWVVWLPVMPFGSLLLPIDIPGSVSF